MRSCKAAIETPVIDLVDILGPGSMEKHFLIILVLVLFLQV